MKKTIVFCALLAGLLSIASCEKAVFDDQQPERTDGKVHVEFRVTQFEELPFAVVDSGTRSVVDISQVCSRINLTLFIDGTKVKAVNQTVDDDGFGRINLDLTEGDYQVVVIAHSGTGSATITSPDEIKFPDNKVTDTFYYYAQLSVREDMTVDMLLKRAVAKFRLVTTDAVPSGIQQLKFYYTGGSSTFDAVKGFGCKESRQTEYRSITADMVGKPAQFEVYTFPHVQEDKLKMTVSVLDASGDAVSERVFEDVPVKLNQITQYTGTFFQESNSTGAATFTLKVDDQWTQQDYSF